jgi:hypothetical protein
LGEGAASQRTGSGFGVWSALAGRLRAACPCTLDQSKTHFNQKMFTMPIFILKIAPVFLTLAQNPLTPP